jgi:hypothetical protein
MWRFEPTRIEDLRHWPVQSIYFTGERFACKTIPRNSFLFPYCMVLRIPGFPLQCHIHVYCLLYVIICWNRVISSYILCMFFISCCYWSPWLSHIWIVASVALEFIYPAGICTGLNYFVSEMLMYSVCGTEGYIQISVFEEISYFSY